MIKIDNLTKKYSDQFAVKSLSLDIDEGNVLGFLGPNGAGKTTTMKMITGFISPDTGDVIVDGLSVKDNSYAVRQSIGYLPEGAPHYGEMMTKDFLKFIINIRDIKNKDSLDFVIESLSLKNILNKRIEHLSKGFKRRVGLAQAIIHDPKYLILDEPTDGVVYNVYENGEREYEGVYENGVPNGRLVYWHENGMIKREGELKKGVPVGRWKEYDVGGILKSKVDH